MARILAPAGGMEQVTAAVRSGADAVYLGVQDFNARRNAANFDSKTLPEAVSYCHARNTEVYVTVNTLVLDSEIGMLEKSADMIASSGADAVIIQDFAVLDLFRNRYPSIKRFASTQTAVHDIDGALFLRDQGFDSVVLARELTLEEMRMICSACGIRTEAFIHGAHCMSLSGACYMSSMIGGRSGNRGLCAQPCRLDWHCSSRDHVLSLKDMSLIDHIKEMVDAGVDTFKIEGRMKRPEYVSASVTACKKALAGEPYDLDTLRSVFSRSGFTDGYLTGKRDINMFGYRTKEDVNESSKVLSAIASTYRSEMPRVPVTMSFYMTEGHATLTVSDGNHTVVTESDSPEKAVSRMSDTDQIKPNILKMGGTPFYSVDTTVDVQLGLFIPTSEINRMRRDALDELLRQRSVIEKHERQEWSFPSVHRYRSAFPSPELWARFYDPSQIVDDTDLRRIIVPVGRITEGLLKRYGDRLTAQLPSALFPADEAVFRESLETLKDLGLSSVWTDNIYGIELGNSLSLDVYGGFGLNITNTQAVIDYSSCGLKALTLSFELAMKQLMDIGGSIPRGIVSYGNLPLMHFRNCPVRASIGCEKCSGKGSLTDRRDIVFPVECTDRKISSLLNCVPLSISERDLSGLDFSLLWFTRENKDTTKKVLEDFRLGRKTDASRTSGLYYRELL